MFIDQSVNSFQFNDELLFDVEICIEISEHCAVFIKDTERMLRNYSEVLFVQAMNKTVFIHLFYMTVT